MTGEYYCPARIDNRDAAKPLPMQKTDTPLQTKKEKKLAKFLIVLLLGIPDFEHFV